MMREIPDFDRMDAAALAELLAYHDERYWKVNSPEISDAEYDRIVEALRRKDPDHPLLGRVNAPAVESSGKVRHSEPMLSLDKAYTLSELLEWAGKYARTPDEPILVEPKYDGISAKFDGKILSTRGDGNVGENISDKLPLIELEAPGYCGRLDRPARGEIIIRNDDFRTLYSKIRKKDGGTYKNSRNAVAGIMGLKDITEMVLQHAKLTLADYSLISYEVKLSELAAHWEELKSSLAELPYPMDGIVLKFADAAFRRSLGNTAHHPRGEIAYKFTNLSAQTKLLDVEWSFGKNCLTPVAILEPVELSGITIKRASLHNAQNIEDMQLMIGDDVVVERAGDVIPYIVSSSAGSLRRSPWISACPSCGTELVRRGPELCCPGENCPEMQLRRLLAAVRNLGIERLGEPTLRKLVTKFGIRHLSELFSITVTQLLQIEGFREKSAANLISEIAKARVVDEAQLLSALNIPNVGANIAALMLEKYSLSELRTAGEEELAQIPGIGPERARAVKETLAECSGELDELLQAVEIRRHAPGSGDLPKICFTGKMPEKRSFYEELAAGRGYKAVSSVTADLALLVAADLSGKSSKLAAAEKYGVRVMSLDEFLAGEEKRDEIPENGGNDTEASQNYSSNWERGELF